MTQNVSGWLPNLIGPVVLADEGTAVAARPTINFVGAPVTVTDNPGANRTDVTISTFGTGVVSLPAVTSFVSTVNGKCTVSSREPVNVQTTSLTTTTLDSFTLASGITTVVWTVTAVKSDLTQAGSWQVSATFRNNAGAVTNLGGAVTSIGAVDDATWIPAADFIGTTARLRVPGKAAITIQYGAAGTVQNTVP